MILMKITNHKNQITNLPAGEAGNDQYSISKMST